MVVIRCASAKPGLILIKHLSMKKSYVCFFLLFLLLAAKISAQSADYSWVSGFGSEWAGNSSSDKALDVALDESGAVYTIGYINVHGPTDTVWFGNSPVVGYGGKDIILAKLDSTGNFLWALPAGHGQDDRGLGLCTDPQGNVLVTGTYWVTCYFGNISLSGTCDHIFVAKASPSGQWLWAVTGGSDGDDHGYDLVTDPQGNIYLTGFVSNYHVQGSATATFGSLPSFSVPDSTAFIAKLSPNGVWQWVQTFGGTDGERDNGLVLDSLGNVYIVGGFYGTKVFGTDTITSINNSRDIFVVKYDASGNYQWVRTTGSALDDRANDVTIDKHSQSLYLTGEFRDHVIFGPDTINNHGGPNGRDIFVAKMTTAGNWVWAQRAGSKSGGDAGRGITINDQGNIFVTGQCKDTVHFGNDTMFVTGLDTIQAFVAGIDTLGDWKWAIQGGGTGDDRGSAIAVDEQCRIYTCGYFSPVNTFFGGIPVVTNGGRDGYVARTDGGCFMNVTGIPPGPQQEVCHPLVPSLFIPETSSLHLLQNDCVQKIQWRIYNCWGQLVFESNDAFASWDGRGLNGQTLPAGMYYYTLEGTGDQGKILAEKGCIALIR